MIKHILLDGTELKSVEGRVVPATGRTEAAYRLIAELLTDRRIGTAAGRQKAEKV